MRKEQISKQYDEIYNRAISEAILHHTCQFFTDKSNGLKPFASGVFVLINNVYFIFTASHVADYLSEKSSNLFIKVGEDDFINVVGRIKRTDLKKSKGVDVAYIKLDDKIIPQLTSQYVFLPLNKIRKHDKLLEGGANYCIFGYPENNLYIENNELITEGQGFFTFPAAKNRYRYYNLSKDDWIIMNMTGKGQDVETKEKLLMNTHFHGLSGCGLWLLMPNTIANTYDYRLIGIMTDYRKDKYYCLIGNKVHLIIEAIELFENIKIRRVKAED